jgi:hypothetical protein
MDKHWTFQLGSMQKALKIHCKALLTQRRDDATLKTEKQAVGLMPFVASLRRRVKIDFVSSCSVRFYILFIMFIPVKMIQVLTHCFEFTVKLLPSRQSIF